MQKVKRECHIEEANDERPILTMVTYVIALDSTSLIGCT